MQRNCYTKPCASPQENPKWVVGADALRHGGHNPLHRRGIIPVWTKLVSLKPEVGGSTLCVLQQLVINYMTPQSINRPIMWYPKT